MKSSHSHCKRLYCTTEGFKAQQTALMHNRQFYCTAEGITTESFTAWQKALMHSRMLYCTAGSFIAQQKVLLHSRKVSPAAETREKFLLRQKLEKSSFCSRNWRKVPSAAETEDKPTLQRLPSDLDSMFAQNLAAAKWYFGAHFEKREAWLPS